MPVGFFINYAWPNDYNLIPIADTYNFAELNFNWGDSKSASSLKFTLKDIDNNIRTQLTLKYSDLIYNPSQIFDPECYTKINTRFKTFNAYLHHYKNNKLDILLLGFNIGTLYMVFLLLYFMYWVIKQILKILFKIIICRRK